MGNYFVKIRATTLERLRDLQRVHDLDVFHHTARQRTDGMFEIQGLLSDEQIDKVRIEGYEVEVTATLWRSRRNVGRRVRAVALNQRIT